MADKKYARVVIKGDGLAYRVTLSQTRAAEIIQHIALLPEKERLNRRPPKAAA